MLAKQFKITKKKESEAIFKKGKSSFDNILGVKKLANNKEINRFIIVVSTKVSKKAVKRNRIKRQISELCRIHYKEIKNGNDFFILALPNVLGKKYNEIEKSFFQHLNRLKVVY